MTASSPCQSGSGSQVRVKTRLTILHLTNPSLEVVKGQVADLILQIIEIHG
jgi:hypothetical protein